MKEYIAPEILTFKMISTDIITTSLIFGAADQEVIGDPEYKSLHDYFQ